MKMSCFRRFNTATANIDCKYMKFCALEMYGSCMLYPRDLFLESTLKRQLIYLYSNFNIFLIYVTMRSILPLKVQSCELKK